MLVCVCVCVCVCLVCLVCERPEVRTSAKRRERDTCQKRKGRKRDVALYEELCGDLYEDLYEDLYLNLYENLHEE